MFLAVFKNYFVLENEEKSAFHMCMDFNYVNVKIGFDSS